MKIALFIILSLFLVPQDSFAARLLTSEDVQRNLNIVWIILATILIFLMKAGFAMVEIGFTRSKNAVNALMKNFVDFAISAVTFWAIGFGLMFGTTNGIFGTDGFYLQDYIKNLDPWLFGCSRSFLFLQPLRLFPGPWPNVPGLLPVLCLLYC